MNEIIQKVVQRGHVTDRDGNEKQLAGAVTEDEANYLYDLICRENLSRTMETGVANGLSTLAMTLAASKIDGHHIGIDPCQITDHKEAAVVLLEEFGVERF
jgi:predicted O-methyltransferase YrrM